VRAPVAAQTGDTLGVAGPDLVGLEFVAQIDQRGDELTIYGFVTHVAGLDDADLFINDLPTARNETAARLTFLGQLALTSRAVLGTLFVVTSTGTVGFFYNEPGGADFAVPESLSSGTRIAEGTLRFRSTVKVYAPDQGLAEGAGEFAYTAADPFTIGGREVRLGEVGLVQEAAVTGQGTLLEPDLPRARLVVAGDLASVG
jgi:hypothetical protein